MKTIIQKRLRPTDDIFGNIELIAVQYVLVYVDNLLIVSHDPYIVMKHLQQRYTIKPDSIKLPDKYLGAEIQCYTIPNTNNLENCDRWAMSPDKYCKCAVTEVKTELEKSGERLKTKVTMPVANNYCPELDVMPELDAQQANYYQELISILW